MIVVAGAGAAGLAAAWYAARAGHEVTVVDRADVVGGMAASRTVAGLRVDHGSHRLHPAADPDDPRRPPPAARRRPPGPAPATAASGSPDAGSGSRCARPTSCATCRPASPPALPSTRSPSPLRRPRADTFAEVLRAGLGPTITDGFYGPYARKLWDADPSELAGDLARRRVSASSPVDLARRLVRGRPPGGPHLPVSRGAASARSSRPWPTPPSPPGADDPARAGAGVASVDLDTDDRVRVRLDDGTDVEAASLVSTLPLAVLARAAGGPSVELRARAMVLVVPRARPGAVVAVRRPLPP